MACGDLRRVDLSRPSAIHPNPGVTSYQGRDMFNLLPPKPAGKPGSLQWRGLQRRQWHPRDRRALGLHLTAAGRPLMVEAETTARPMENESAWPSLRPSAAP